MANDTNDTRERLLKAAAREFAEKGLKGARITQIAKGAKINAQAIYHYFGSKEDLYVIVLENTYNKFIQAWHDDVTGDLDTLDPRTAIERLINAIFEGFRRNEEMLRIVTDNVLHQSNFVKTKSTRTSVLNEITAALDRILERGRKENIFRFDIDSINIYLTIMAFSRDYLYYIHSNSALFGQDFADGEHIDRWRNHIIDFTLRGLAPARDR